MLPLPVTMDRRVAGPTVVSTGAVCVRGSLREVCTGVPVSWLPLGCCKLGFLIFSEVPGLPVGRPATERALELGSLQRGEKEVSSGLDSPSSLFTNQLDTPSPPLNGRNSIVQPCVQWWDTGLVYNGLTELMLVP